MNSIPMPTPGSQVRTTAGVMILSESIQKMMVKAYPVTMEPETPHSSHDR